MRHSTLALILSSALAGCTGSAPQSAVGYDPGESSGGKADGQSLALPDVRCAGAPDAGPKQHWQNPVHAAWTKTAGLDQANHRGIDLVAAASTNPQLLTGEMRYGLKSLEFENVTLFGCRAEKWELLGNATTDSNGVFYLELTDDARLPIGVRSLYVSVDGDRSGAEFVGMVVPDGAPVMFSDVDGTLTSSENAAVGGLLGLDVKPNDGASAALTGLVGKGYPIVYVTAMARTFIQNRRDWLAAKGFPRGALRMADGVLLPGQATIDYKTETFSDVADTGLVPTIGFGNRASDATAYGNVGLTGDHIFLKLGQFDSEDQPVIDAGKATGVTSYAADAALFTALPAAQAAQ